VALAVAIVPALKCLLTRKLGAAELLAGALFIWISLALATAFWLRGFSYLFLWPSVFGTTALWIVARRESVSITASIFAMVGTAAAACVLFAPTILLSYYALTIGLLAAWIGLTSYAIWLVCLPQRMDVAANEAI
jgi:hypothetical protein